MEEDQFQEDLAEADGRRSFSTLVLVATAVVALLVGASASFAAVTVFGSSDPVTAAAAQPPRSASSANSCGEDAPGTGEAVEIPGVTTNLADSGHYVRVRISAELAADADPERFHSQWPMISDVMVGYLGSKTSADFVSRDLVKEELTCLIKERLVGGHGEPVVAGINFLDFVVQ